jgi:uncharacterized ion transporter superfamily protein YfcC
MIGLSAISVWLAAVTLLIGEKFNALKVVLITIGVFLILTWILPAAYFQSEYVEQGRLQMGLFDIFSYPITALSYFGYIALFLLVIGGFYGILGKIGAYRAMLDKLVSCFKGKEKIVLAAIMVIIAVLTSLSGLEIALLIFFPMIISLILLMGYDKVTAAIAIVGSVIVGIAGTTFAYNTLSSVVSIFGLDITYEIITKIVILVLGLAILIFNVFWHIGFVGKNKTKKSKQMKTTKAAKKEDSKVVDTKKDEKDSAFIPEKVTGKVKAIWPLIVLLSLIVVILILAFTGWNTSFEKPWFEDATTAVTGFTLFGFAIFGKILGVTHAFGAWSLTDLIALLVIIAGILALIYKIKFNDFIDAFAKGVKRALLPAFIVILIYTCLVIVTYHPFQLVVYEFILGLTNGFNIFTTSIVAILAAAFNVEPLYAFQSVLPYMTSLGIDPASHGLIGIIFQSLYGLVMFVAPTSIILMVVLAYLNISYKDWLKSTWKIVVQLLIVMVIIFTILMLI